MAYGRATRQMRALVLAGEDDAPGFIGERADSHGVELVVVRRDPDGYPPALSAYDFVLSLGSKWSVTAGGSTPWVAREVGLVRTALEQDVPVLGVCFGAQVLAAALGAAVRVAPRPEFGWIGIESLDEVMIPEGPWLAWHYDVVDLPDQARLLAANSCGVQAFQAGRSIGLQFHPEVTPAILGRWLRDLDSEPAAADVDAGELLSASAALLAAARGNAHTLFDHFLRQANLLPAAGEPAVSAPPQR